MRLSSLLVLPLITLLVFAGCKPFQSQGPQPIECDVSFVILGIGQDAGAPQISRPNDPAWSDRSKRMLATSAAVLDHRTGQRYLFEATPDIREQIQILDELMPDAQGSVGLSGIFLTHAHIGHYAGLMFLGRESAGAQAVPVYAMPRMKDYLETNGPWDQLVRLNNIDLKQIAGKDAIILPGDIQVSTKTVPHRDEYSETVAYVVSVNGKSLMFLPDIDSFEGSDDPEFVLNQALMEKLDYIYLDATFYDDNELPGRDMSKIPHPRMTASMDMFDEMGSEFREKVRFIHLNHTNPARFRDSPQAKIIRARGYQIAKRGEQVCLSAA